MLRRPAKKLLLPQELAGLGEQPGLPPHRALVCLIQQRRDLPQRHYSLLHVDESAAQLADILPDTQIYLAKRVERAHLHGSDAVLLVVGKREATAHEHDYVGDALGPMRDPSCVEQAVARVPVRRNELAVLLEHPLFQCRPLLRGKAVEAPPIRDDPSARLEPSALEVLSSDHSHPIQPPPNRDADEAEGDDDQHTEDEAQALHRVAPNAGARRVRLE
mmetsp:Transcript_35486/g.102198  ORF Transcript_35486/g.102198 Transcript_35486/m.102198 type:complete len:218 (-) Transcript_35486:964-1617(-)